MLFEKDLVIVYIEDKPLTFARIEEIGPDFKPEWFQVKLLILQLPVKIVTWTLNDLYLAGDEFTMDGQKIRLEKIVAPKELKPDEDKTGDKKEQNKSKGAEIISFQNLKKK